MNWLARIIFFKLLGWNMSGVAPIHLKKAVFIVVPHTSWHDFYLGLLVRRIMRMNIKFVAKMELFKAPFGWYFKWMGGTPLDRTPGQKKVEAIARIFKERKEFLLAIAPEGTRKKVLKWKTGFYFISKEAGVPIIMVAFDYGTKTVKISAPFSPTWDEEQDFYFMQQFYAGVKGKVINYS